MTEQKGASAINKKQYNEDDGKYDKDRFGDDVRMQLGIVKKVRRQDRHYLLTTALPEVFFVVGKAASNQQKRGPQSVARH